MTVRVSARDELDRVLWTSFGRQYAVPHHLQRKTDRLAMAARPAVERAGQGLVFHVHCILCDDRGSSSTTRSGESAPGGAAKQEPPLALLQTRSCCVRTSISSGVG